MADGRTFLELNRVIVKVMVTSCHLTGLHFALEHGIGQTARRKTCVGLREQKTECYSFGSLEFIRGFSGFSGFSVFPLSTAQHDVVN